MDDTLSVTESIQVLGISRGTFMRAVWFLYPPSTWPSVTGERAWSFDSAALNRIERHLAKRNRPPSEVFTTELIRPTDGELDDWVKKSLDPKGWYGVAPDNWDFMYLRRELAFRGYLNVKLYPAKDASHCRVCGEFVVRNEGWYHYNLDPVNHEAEPPTAAM